MNIPQQLQVRTLAAAHVSAEVIAVRLSLPLYEVIDELSALAHSTMVRQVGRPSSEGRCQHCGAPPCKQRRIKTKTRTTTRP